MTVDCLSNNAASSITKKKPAETKVKPWGETDKHTLSELIQKGKVDIDRLNNTNYINRVRTIIFHIVTNVNSFLTSELSGHRGILKLHATERGKKTAKVSHNNIIASSHVKIITSFLTPPSENSLSDGESNNNRRQQLQLIGELKHHGKIYSYNYGQDHHQEEEG